MVNNVCRSFLWHEVANNFSLGNVAFCKTKNEGGLGIRKIDLWNKVAIGKIVWDINFLKKS